MNKVMNKVMNKKRLFVAFCWELGLIAAAWAFLSYSHKTDVAIDYLLSIRFSTIFLLAVNIFAMYHVAGWIWYPYFMENNLNPGQLGRIQYELNFVNTVAPFINTSGEAYALARLGALGVSKEKTRAMMTFRYFITIVTKWIEIIVAVLLIFRLDTLKEESLFTVVTFAITYTIIISLIFGVMLKLFQAKARIPKIFLESDRFGDIAAKAQLALDDFLSVLNMTLSQGLKPLISFLCGLLYSFLEIMPFLIIATAMGGRMGLLLPIIIAAGAGIVVDVIPPTSKGVRGYEVAMFVVLSLMGVNVVFTTIVVAVICVPVSTYVATTPIGIGGFGIGGFDMVMIVALSLMGVNIAFAVTVVIVTRVLVLTGTIITGLPFFKRDIEV